MKKFNKGMYGGKFIPFHKGHLFCLDRAAQECEKVYLLMFINGDQEIKILKNSNEDILKVENRIKQIERVAKNYDNVIFKVIDVLTVKLPDGTEDWDGETPLVLEACEGEPDAVYGSEESYVDYFNRAYPNAEVVLVDCERKNVPISATMIRAMKDIEERKFWMV